ncbi:MAG TPA: hypothetical protein VN441_16295 [Syntrophomonas sp.]|nr:hypothetical protein [Syntrophomonas sp.]
MDGDDVMDALTLQLAKKYVDRRTQKTFVCLIKNGTQIAARVPWDDNNDLFHLWEYPRVDRNKGLNMIGLYTCPKSQAINNLTGTLFKNASDDITPLQFNFGYVGGNHGYNHIDQITATGHGKVVQDIGSVWTINGKNYLILDIVDANTLKTIQDYSGTPTFPADNLGSTSGTLAHVSGATNTEDIVYTAKTTLQLTPNTNNKSVALVLDGKEIEDDGVYFGDKFDLVEKYNIINIRSLQTYLKANVGGSIKPNLADDSLAPGITVTNIFTHGRNGSLTVKTGYEMFIGVASVILGAVQSMKIGSKAYIPGVGVVAGKDMSTVVTQEGNTLEFINTAWLDANNPPYRFHQFNDDLSKGIALGYNTGFGMAKPITRKTGTKAGAYSGENKKMYPYCRFGGTLSAGNYLEVVSFRVPLRIIDSDATCLYWYWLGNDIYLAFDYHQSIDKTIELPSYMAGMKIEQLDVHANTTIQGEIVSAKGIKVKVINNYGYGVLRLYN